MEIPNNDFNEDENTNFNTTVLCRSPILGC